jgi:hypothetical protein
MQKPAATLAAGIAALFLPLSANATLLSFEFSGHVSTILSDDSSGTFGASFAVNDPVQGVWFVDSTASANPLLPTIQYYDSFFGVTIGAHTFMGPAQYRHFDDDPTGGDGFSVINEDGFFAGPFLGPLMPRTFFLQFTGMPATTFSGFDLITDPKSLVPQATFALHGLRLDSALDDSFGALYFTVDSFQQVPEPGTMLLLALGVVGLAVWRRRTG